MTLKSYLKIGMVGSIVLAIILSVSLVTLFKTMGTSTDVLKNRNEISVLVANLENTSSYLTVEARLYK